MSGAAEVSIMTGPSASVVHHATAWVHEVSGLDPVSSLAVVLGGPWLGLSLICAGVALVQRCVKVRPLYLSLRSLRKLRK